MKASAYIIADGSVNTVHIEHSNTRWSKPAKVHVSFRGRTVVRLRVRVRLDDSDDGALPDLKKHGVGL